MTIRRNKESRVRVFRLEDLETRDMLSGHGLAGFLHLGAGAHAAGIQTAAAQISAQAAAHSQVFAALGSSSSTSDKTVLAATLTDSETGETAKVTYKTHTEDGVTETEFKVKVTGAAADTPLEVAIGGTVVGQITTDSNGAGTLKLSSDPDDDEQALPANFPTDIAAGTAVSVGSLTGELAARTHAHHGCGEHTALTASLTDSSSSATGTATFHSTTKHDETTTTLKVSVTGATASSSLPVAIDGTVIGQLSTDAAGAGSAVFSTNPGTDEVQATFPTTVSAGSTITVGSLSGTFATDTSAVMTSAFRFGRWR
jgi:hypothetical protein